MYKQVVPSYKINHCSAKKSQTSNAIAEDKQLVQLGKMSNCRETTAKLWKMSNCRAPSASGEGAIVENEQLQSN